MMLPTKIIVDKLYRLVNLILSIFIKPDMSFENIRELNMETIEQLKTEFSIKAVFLDVDDTLRSHFNIISIHNRKWIRELKNHIKVIVVSNGIDASLKYYFEKNDIKYISLAFKPLKRGFKKACTILNVEPEHVLVIGNDLLSDIYGGIRNNMKTALIKNVE